ncbi:NACHT domain-containing protein [Kitasatospora griseola]|uniref:NACHT domain-containing protein n=1 Tax=Kitasatospora griseola TaxID=2064 RepID=UPI003855BEC4
MTDELTGPEALAEQLNLLQAKLLARGKDQRAVVVEANIRRHKVERRPLSTSRVNDWFPRQRGSSSKKLSVPSDVDDLWDVVEVMLDWTGQLASPSERSRLRAHWANLCREAQRKTGLDDDVLGYLEAVRKFAEQQDPYFGRTGLPFLAHLYVDQRIRPMPTLDERTGPGGDDAAPAGSGLAAAAKPGAMFRKSDPVCVVISGPGTGKSTLLRARLRDAAHRWLDNPKAVGRTLPAVPVLVDARLLAGEETHVADALAAATGKLARYGPGLTPAHFLQKPCPGAHWQLLVDGLDELPNADERRAVLEKLANAAAAADPPLYRSVVATRPLSENELDVLGGTAPRYELQPFTVDDLHNYAEKYFSTRWPQEEAVRRARQFTDALRDASLIELARTPLMAFMLCQLHLEKPERPLPNARTAVYTEFTDLLFENNKPKNVAKSHEEAIENLVEHVQSPRARNEARSAAGQVHDQLSELIDYLAHQWLTSPHQAPVTEVLSAHEAVHRPSKVRQVLWEAFLEDLLLHTGLVVHRANGLEFPHRTFLEFHAARHATRDEQARTVLDELFPHGQTHRVPAIESSYLGFLLDGLLASPDGIAAETVDRIEKITRGAGDHALRFLLDQVDLRTSLPPAPTARQLTRFAQDKALHGTYRVSAAERLAKVDGQRDCAAKLLAQLADDTTFTSALSFLFGSDRVTAALCLANVDKHKKEGVSRLIAFTKDNTLSTMDRVQAAGALAQVDGCQKEGAARLIAFANDTTLDSTDRVRAVAFLTGVEEYRKDGVARLIAFANDTTLDSTDREVVAVVLAEVDGQRDRAAELLAQLADDATLDGVDRVQAAESLAKVDGHQKDGVARLIAFANDTTLDSFHRLSAALGLARVDGHLEEGADRLMAFAGDPSFNGVDRVQAAKNLAEVDGYGDRAAQLLAQLAGDTTLDGAHRMWAAEGLAKVDGYQDRAAQLLAQLAGDTTLDGAHRMWAAEGLAKVDGYQDRAARLFAELADDATLDGAHRMWAAEGLAKVDGYLEEGADRLMAFAGDPSFNGVDRVQAAENLAEVNGYGDRAAQLLAQLAGDTTLDSAARIRAAQKLTAIHSDGGAEPGNGGVR